MRRTKNGASRQKPSFSVVPAGWPGEVEWQNSFRQEKEKLRQRQQEIPVPDNEELAEQLVQAQQQTLSKLAEKREEVFWNQAGLDFRGRSEPYINKKCFSAARCSAIPSEEAARQWFRVLAEQDAVKQAVAKQAVAKQAVAKQVVTKQAVNRRVGEDTSSKKQIPWGDVWKSVQKIELDYQVADFVWKEHCRWSSTGNPWIILRAWVLATVKSDYLLPLLKRDQPGANKALLQEDLAIEVVAFSDRSPLVQIEVRQADRFFLTVTVERTMHFLRADLPVPDFVALPSYVATLVRQALQQDEESVNRLLPKTRDCLLSLSAPAGDPIDAVITSERNAEMLAEIQTLPPQRRQAIELYLEGLPRQSIAAQMGIGDETVKTHLSYVFKQLRFTQSASDDIS